MKQRLSVNLMLLCLVMGSFVYPRAAFSHEFEPGHIERSIDVVIRDRNVQIKYAIGLADITMLDWLVRESEIEPAAEQRLRGLIEDHESSQSPESESDPTAADGKASSEPAEFQREIADLFKEKLSAKIFENLKLSCNETPLSFTEKKLTDTSRHHVVLECILTATIPDGETVVLCLADQNFLEMIESEPAADPESPNSPRENSAVASGGEQDFAVKNAASDFRFHGSMRRACRVKGDAVLVNSNVVPVLARAKATDIGAMNREQRLDAATIETKLVFATEEAPKTKMADQPN